MLFQTFENDIELRLELQFLHRNHCVFFKDIFCTMAMFDQLVGLKNLHKFIETNESSHKEQIHKNVSVSLAKILNEEVYNLI